MKVKELIEQLQEQDPESEVLAYNDLDEGYCNIEKVEVQEKDNYYYCKGFSPDEYNYNKVVTLSGSGI